MNWKSFHPPKLWYRCDDMMQSPSYFSYFIAMPCLGQIPATTPTPLPINGDWELSLTPVNILSHRWINDGGILPLELLVQREERPIEEAS